jgi:pimeloyl-[acyl-carrier protein] methyl ester esterase
MNQGIWQPFLEHCQQKWGEGITFNAIDLPGFGTQHNVELPNYEIDSLADNVKQVLRPNSIVVGWSMGGLVAQRLVDVAEPRIVAQIQIASTPKFSDGRDWNGIRQEVLLQFQQQLRVDHLQLLKRFLSIQCIGLAKPKEQMKAMLDAICMFPLSTSENLAKSLQFLSDADLRPNNNSQAQNSVPTLRIFGGLDSLIPSKAIPAIEALYPNDHIAVIKKASHAAFLTHPKSCFELMDEFMNSFSGQSTL